MGVLETCAIIGLAISVGKVLRAIEKEKEGNLSRFMIGTYKIGQWFIAVTSCLAVVGMILAEKPLWKNVLFTLCIGIVVVAMQVVIDMERKYLDKIENEGWS